MVDLKARTSIKYLEDLGLQISSKKESSETSKKPPKLRKTSFTNIEYIAKSGLNCLTPQLSKSFPSQLYNGSNDSSYFEQCYNVLDSLGEGSFGYVLKVASKDDPTLFALKISKEPFKGLHDRSLKLKELEYHLLLSDHPNIVSLYDAWEEDGLLYMMMELCKSNLTKVTTAMPEDEVWNVLVDVTLALNLLHDQGMGHFDVKLENILLGCDGLYKLTDFGLTFPVKNPIRKQPVEGDAKYLPPEILLEDKFSEKADIFGLGISVLELVGNLVLPSNGDVWKALREDTFPRDKTQHISDELFSLLTRMMASDWSQRPSTMEILNNPRIRAILNQRSMYTLVQPLGFPSDKVHRFVFMCMVFYALVHLVNQQLTMQRPELMSVDTSFESESPKKENEGETKMFTSLVFTSTPYLCRLKPGINNQTDSYWNQDVTGISECSPISKSSTSEGSSSVSDPAKNVSPLYSSYMSILSPIKLSRSIKVAIKKHKYHKKWFKRMQKNAQKTLFSNMNNSVEKVAESSGCETSNESYTNKQDNSFEPIKAKLFDEEGKAKKVTGMIFFENITEEKSLFNDKSNNTEPTELALEFKEMVKLFSNCEEESLEVKDERNCCTVSEYLSVNNADSSTPIKSQITTKNTRKRFSQNSVRRTLFNNNDDDKEEEVGEISHHNDESQDKSDESQDKSVKRKKKGVFYLPYLSAYDDEES